MGTKTLMRPGALLASNPVGTAERRSLQAAVADQGRVTRVATIDIGDICPTPESENSRSAGSYDTQSIAEIAESIRVHGIIQPVVVRPIQAHEAERYKVLVDGAPTYPQFVIIAGNRRYHGAVAAGRRQVPCVIRVTDSDTAYVLNVVENLQRRALSGKERANSLARLASLQGEEGTPMGVRELARRTGFAPGVISQWLSIHRSAVLKEAVESERLDIGRAMKLASLASLSDQRLAELVNVAVEMPQNEVAALASEIRNSPEVTAKRTASVNVRRAMEAYRVLMLIDVVDDDVRTALDLARKRLTELLD